MVLAIGLAVIAVLSGCEDQASAAQDTTARALLDTDTGQIVMPLSAYDITDMPADLELLNRVLFIRIGECMSEKGQRFTATMASTAYPDDRDYGIWYESNARIYGWGFPASELDAAFEADAAAGGAQWETALQECDPEANEDPEIRAIIPEPSEFTDSLVPNLRTEAYRDASAHPDWQEAREEWWTCLEEAGLEPLRDATEWRSAQSKTALEESGAAPEELIVLATTEAQCNNETGLTQTLANLTASFEAPLISENQAALNEYQELKQSRLAAAREYIAVHG